MEALGSAIVIQILHGLAYGMLLFLVSSGLTLVFGMMSSGAMLPVPGDDSVMSCAA